ncbi:MAG TPA: kelch repeat-containing protein, partial [Flavisolibacter sp.]|nr:kelch repeat-containing protein [Flavisolibacter sp.]
MKKTLLLFLCHLFYLFTFAQGELWTWMHGDTTGNKTGIYGTKGVPAAANKPGARDGAVSWTDASGNFWLFGGKYPYTFDDKTYYFNDLWKYNPTTNQWTWVSGDSFTNSTGIYGTKGVPAAANKPGARDGAVSWTDASGNFWLFGG